MSKGKENVIRSDHYPMILELKNMPKAKTIQKKESQWNLKKPGGWDIYKVALEEVSAKMQEVTKDKDLDIEAVMKKTEAMMNKVKFKAFGKSKPTTEKALSRRLEDRLKAAQGLEDKEKIKELRRRQYDMMEEEINRLKLAKYGRSTSVFKMKEIVAGSKKSQQEAHAVIDEETKELVVGTDEIKEVTLKHCVKSLKNGIPEEEVKQIVDLVNNVHDERMKEVETEDDDVTIEDFEEVLSKIEKKNKRSYDFLIRTGEGFKESIFQLCKRIIRDETVPANFFETTLHQLWKKKFPKEDLNNHRFIHMKNWLPKCCEALLVSKMKPRILEAGTKYQIGGKPFHRVEEHLITVKALISRSISTNQGCMVQLVDIKGFFDAESLRGVMQSLYCAQIPLEMYRMWFKMNAKTVISVATPSGMTKPGEAGELCGQGSAGAALASQLDIDLGISCYFKSSSEEASYGSVRIQPQTFQDDILRVAPTLASARSGNIKLHMMLSERLLKCHPKKTCFILYGSKAYKDQIIQELESSPLKFGDFSMLEKNQDTYLGDVLNTNGLSSSVEATVTQRLGKVKGAIY